MANNAITMEQINKLLQIQNEFDDRIPTKNVKDSTTAYIIEFFEWFNTIESFKNWKKNPGKPKETQLDELSDMLAFGLSLVNQTNADLSELEEAINKLDEDQLDKDDYTSDTAMYGFMIDITHFDLDANEALFLPIRIANRVYTIEELINAYLQKMQHNHQRQDGTADKDKGYV